MGTPAHRHARTSAAASQFAMLRFVLCAADLMFTNTVRSFDDHFYDDHFYDDRSYDDRSYNDRSYLYRRDSASGAFRKQLLCLRMPEGRFRASNCRTPWWTEPREAAPKGVLDEALTARMNACPDTNRTYLHHGLLGLD
jgi:hypothetical protein